MQSDIVGLLATFYDNPKRDGAASEKAGRDIYKNILYIKIVQAGAKDEVDRKATEEDKARFVHSWGSYENREKVPVDGTPLETWSMLSALEVKLLKGYNVLTIESLSTLPDSRIQKMGPGITALRDKALYFIKTLAPKAALANELKTRDEKIADLEKKLKELAERLMQEPIEESAEPKRIPRKKKVASG